MGTESVPVLRGLPGAARSVMVGDLPIRKGTDVWIPIRQIHRDVRWFSEPDSFNSNRWNAGARRPKFSYFPVVFERDEFPSGATARPGAPQGKQAHGLLGGAMKALEELFPDFAQDLVQAKALPVNHGCEPLLEFPVMDPFPRREWNWLTYSLSRPLIELTMRRRVERQGNITLRGGCRVLEIVGRPDGALVTGVRCETVSGPEMISADRLCNGRDSRPAVGRQDLLDGSDHLVSARRTVATTGSTAARGFVAVDDGKLVGFVAGQRTRRFDCDSELQWINVAEERRGQGIADKLMAQIGAWSSSRMPFAFV